MGSPRWSKIAAVVVLFAACAMRAGAERPMRVLITFHHGIDVEIIKELGGIVHIIIEKQRCCCASLPPSVIARLRRHALVEFVEPDVQMKLPTCDCVCGDGEGHRHGHGDGHHHGHRHDHDHGHDDGGGTPPPEPPPTPAPAPQPLTSGIDRIDAEQSSARSGDGAGAVDVDVAVLDTGIDLTHPDLNVYRNVSFVPGAATGADDFGHGSHIAGTVGARDNNEGVVGVAPGARLWAVKVADRLGNAYPSNVANGLGYVIDHAAEIDVAVLCIGYRGANSLLTQAITACVAAGVPVVVAAGNGGIDANDFTPANHPDAITVSAIVDTDGRAGGAGPATVDGADDSFAAFSNFGSCIDLAAPGSAIASTWMGGGYQTISGTSAAAPFVAGAAALYRSTHPGATPAQVRQALIDAAFPQVGPNGFTGDPDGNPEPLVNAGGL